MLEKYDQNNDGQIGLKEFQSFVSKDPEILKLLYNYGIISKEDLRPDFGTGENEMPDADSDFENELLKEQSHYDELSERIKNGIEHTEVLKKNDFLSNKLDT